VRTLGRYWLALTLVAATVVTSAALYRRLPASIPIHWNAQGVVDGWAPKSQGAFIGPCAALVIVALLILLEPWPKKEGGDTEAGAKSCSHPAIVASVAGILFYANALVLMVGIGWHLDMPSHVIIAVGLLVAVLGNSLGKVPQNGVVGIRTSWTLADEEVWARTHRIAGWLFVLAGAVTVITGFMGHGMPPGLIAIGAAAVVSVGYSYVVSRRLNRGDGGSS
jgi:uncharacterized membrane protein